MRLKLDTACAAMGISAVALGACSPDDISTTPAVEQLQAVTSALVPVGWTRGVSYPAGFAPASVQLLMDGTVLAQDDSSNTWRRFYPDPVSGYTGGAWRVTGSSHYQRDYFATGMLRDGRYFIGGGEGLWLNGVSQPDSQKNKCEIYNPLTGRWSDLPDFPSDTYLADGVTAPLPNGTLLVGAPHGDSWVFDPSVCPMDGSPCSSSPWGSFEQLPGVPTSFPFFSEGSLTPLQSGDVFLTQRYKNGMDNLTGAAVYHWNGSPPRWSVISHDPSQGPRDDPFRVGPDEGGSALTLHGGKVFIASATGFNAIYDPTPGNPDPIQNTFPTPQMLNMAENCQVVMPTGNLLLVINPASFSGTYTFYEYNPQTGFLSTPPGGPTYTQGVVFQTPLPDGTIMVINRAAPTMYLYRPAEGQDTMGRPRITSLGGFTNGQYTLSGVNLNGTTNGANRDDEGQNFTSFPVVTITSGGQTWYGSVTNLSTMSIAPNAQGVVQFTMPPAVPHTTVTVSVSASGQQSANSISIANTLWLPTPAQFLLL